MTAGVVGGSLPDKRSEVGAMPPLLDAWLLGEGVAIGVCFRGKQCFERDRPFVMCLYWLNDSEMSSLSEADSR